MKTKKMISISILVYISALVFVGSTLAGWEEDYERSTRAAEGVRIQTEMIKKNQKALVDKDNLLFQRITDLFVQRDAKGAITAQATGGNSSDNNDGVTAPDFIWDPPGSGDSPDDGIGGVVFGPPSGGGSSRGLDLPPDIINDASTISPSGAGQISDGTEADKNPSDTTSDSGKTGK